MRHVLIVVEIVGQGELSKLRQRGGNDLGWSADLRIGALGMSAPSDPLSMAVVTGKYWGPSPRTLTVSFMESTPSDLRARIVSHLNAWTRTGCVTFAQTQGTGQVRISRGAGGYWSYLGTDVLLIPQNRPTMNLQSFTMNTAESEYKRVIRHEAGHTLDAPHEHMRKELVARIDRQKARHFRRTRAESAAGRCGSPARYRTFGTPGPDLDHVLPVAGSDQRMAKRSSADWTTRYRFDFIVGSTRSPDTA
jgi:hypothetical protein